MARVCMHEYKQVHACVKQAARKTLIFTLFQALML